MQRVEKQMLPSLSSEIRTVHGLLDQQAERHGEKTFMVFRDEAWSYAGIRKEADRVAAGLQSLGIRQGDKVALMMTNRPEFLFVWFGLSKLGAVEVSINTAHRGDLLSYMLDKADCTLLVIEAQFLPVLQEVIADLPKLQTLVLLGEQSLSLPGKTVRSYREVTANTGQFEAASVKWSDPALMLFTSGTTGPSKGALMPQNYGIHMAELVCGRAGYGPDDCLYNALPLFHGNAKVLSTLPALLSGARMVLAERFSVSQFWEEVKRYGCTEFNYIGGILAILLKADPRPDDADNSLRILFGGGATPGVYEEFERRFAVTLIEGYGMSEIGLPLMSSLSEKKPGSCGKPHPDYEVRLIDDDDGEVAVDTPGELLVRPKKPWSMLLGYYAMPEKTVEAWQDLWFHTGDYLKRDAQGFYHFVDRKKDAIRRRGENISSFEVERGVASHPAVLECAAIPIPSELGEDEVMVCVVARPGATLDHAELARHCEKKMAKFMVPRYYRLLARLPKTPTERVQKFQLRQQGVTADTWDREKQLKGGA
ncbi:MAG: AMP-binding protein [Proteobacteria bacterium]|nr:AMP-binding protein [Pseudomonadota bacterium]